MSRRPRTGARRRGAPRGGQLAASPARPESPARLGYGGGDLGSPAAGGSRGRGPEAHRVGAQGLATSADSQQRDGPFHLRPQIDYRPSSPACFDRDVTSAFFFRFLDPKRAASLQPRGFPGPFPPRRCAAQSARGRRRPGRFRRLLGRGWALPGPGLALGPRLLLPIAPPT